MPFVFYDLETTGRLPEFDQFVQFAAVKTDDQLNEVDSFSLRCRLARHIVPSPEALLVNRVTPAMLTDPALPSYYEALRQVRSKFCEWSPAVFIGYYSIEFDEDFLRQGFYQTLQPPFLTNTGGNARGDVLNIVHATAIYAPPVFKIPKNHNGDPVYKLDQLAPVNGYTLGGQHEAMGDVRATLFLAAMMQRKAGVIWDTMIRWTRKRAVAEFLLQAGPVWHSDVFGRNRSYSWRVTYCGQNSDRDSQLAAFDLQFDPKEVIDLPVEKLIAILNDSPKRIRTISTNRQPILMPSDIKPAEGVCPNVPEHHIKRRAGLVAENPRFRERVGKALAGRFPEQEPKQFVEQRIYDGFMGPDDQDIADDFHSSGWEDRVGLFANMRDERARELGERLVYLERPEALPKTNRKRLDAWLKERMLTNDPAVPWMTVPKALAEIDRLSETPKAREEKAFLRDMGAWLRDISRRKQA